MVDGWWFTNLFPKQCGHTGGSYGSYKGRVFIRGGLMRAQHLWWNLQHKRALLCERCPFAFRLHRLAQTKRRGELSRNPLVTLRASDRSHCGGVRIFRSLAQHSSLCACQTALIVAWCEFGDPSRNPLGTLSLSDRSRCGPVLVLRSLAQPSRHFGRVRSLSLWRGADFDHQGGGLL